VPKLTVIHKPSDIDALRQRLETADLVAFDTETTGVHKGAEIIGFSLCFDETEAFYVVLSYWDKDASQLKYWDNKVSATALIQVLAAKRLIMHNAIFDCTMVENFFKVSLINSLHTDTMVLAHLLDENRRIGLKELATNLFGDSAADEAKAMKESIVANGGSASKANYELYKADWQLIAKYGAQDALLTYKMFLALVPELYDQGLDQFFYEDESMPLLKGATYDLNTVGLRVDTTALTTLKKTLEAECAEAHSFIYAEIKARISDKYPGTNKKNTFNIGSNVQLSWLVFSVYGLEFNGLTKEGKSVAKALGLRIPYTRGAKSEFIRAVEQNAGQYYVQPANGKGGKKYKEPWAYIAVDKEALKKHAPKYKWIEKFLEYQKKQKILHTYVEGIEERLNYGAIQPQFLQTGTTSGRYSSRNPNFQNLPRDDKRVKACIVSRPGKVFVGADYSQLEPRVFAYFSQDERLKAAFKGEDDFYSVIGMEVYGKTDCTPQKEGSPDAFGVKYKKLRDLSKVIALASTYGASAWQLMKTTGKSEADTQEDINAYFERFPGVAKMMTDSHNMAKKDGFVTNLFGRKRRMPDAMRIQKMYGTTEHHELPYEARKMLNLAVNHRIQSTGASIINRAVIQFCNNIKELGIDAKVVVQVHDSLVVECPEADAEAVSLLLQDAMENTVKLESIDLEAVPKVGKTLADV
jgi:DNA polymerase-1